MPSHITAKRLGMDEILPTEIEYVVDITNIANDI